MGVTADIPLRALFKDLENTFRRLSTRFETVVTVVNDQGLSLNVVNDVDDMLSATVSYAFTVCVNYNDGDGIVTIWARVPLDNFPDNGSDIRASSALPDISYLRLYTRENFGDVGPSDTPGSLGVDYITLRKPSGGYIRVRATDDGTLTWETV